MSHYSVIIAIDGPSGAGKSTLAKALAKRLNFYYLDTGAMYRALAWQSLRAKINLKDKKKIIDFCKKQKMELINSGRIFKVFLNGKDVDRNIRAAKIGEIASILSRIQEVRDIINSKQREAARRKRIILDGRDIGTVVFPEADCKIFLDASLKERTKRRFHEFFYRGVKVDSKSVQEDLKRRDSRDSLRRVAPLRKARDAVLLDTTNLSIQDMVEAALKIISRKIKLDVL